MRGSESRERGGVDLERAASGSGQDDRQTGRLQDAWKGGTADPFPGHDAPVIGCGTAEQGGRGNKPKAAPNPVRSTPASARAPLSLGPPGSQGFRGGLRGDGGPSRRGPRRRCREGRGPPAGREPGEEAGQSVVSSGPILPGEGDTPMSPVRRRGALGCSRIPRGRRPVRQVWRGAVRAGVRCGRTGPPGIRRSTSRRQ